MKTNDLNIGAEVLKIHKQKRVTNVELAEFLGIDRHNVKRDVFDKKSIDTDILRKLCEYYDYNFFSLFMEGNQNRLPQKDVKATVIIEMGEHKAEKQFTISVGDNRLKIE
jgi:DNA-binding Xre family transcriptional regulator